MKEQIELNVSCEGTNISYKGSFENFEKVINLIREKDSNFVKHIIVTNSNKDDSSLKQDIAGQLNPKIDGWSLSHPNPNVNIECRVKKELKNKCKEMTFKKFGIPQNYSINYNKIIKKYGETDGKMIMAYYRILLRDNKDNLTSGYRFK